MTIAQDHFRLAMAHLNANRVQQALAEFEAAARLAPRAASAHHMTGIALQRLGRLSEADKAISAAIAINPNEPDFHANRSLVRSGLGLHDIAIADARKALEIAPQHVGALCNMGLAQIAKGEYAAAAQTFVTLMAAAPTFDAGRTNLLLALRNIENPEERLRSAAALVAVAPHDAEAWAELGKARYTMGRQGEAVDAFQRATELAPDNLDFHSLLLFNMNALDGLSKSDRSRALKQHEQAIRRSSIPRNHFPVPGSGGKQLRLGFVSGDLREHSVSHFLLTALPALRERGLHLVAYQTNATTDRITERLRPMFDAWRNITEMSDDAAADQIGTDAVDILFDLAGHTKGRRQRLFGLRPAPLSVAWLGYSASTGNPGIDYVLCNDWVLPPQEEPAFTERPLRMKGNYLCFSLPESEAPVPTDSEHMTFGSFNTLNKLSDRTVLLWSRILAGVPNSQLALKARAFKSAEVRAETARRFARHGVAPNRIFMIERTPDRASHLALYGRVGMALDTWPYSGTTTTMEALSMGVPVLTLNDGSFISRVSASLLHEAGLDDWIAANEDEYVDKAVAAAQPERLAGERPAIRRQVIESRLCDAASFAADFEATLRGAWQRWCRGVGKPGKRP